jgi:hypothetical protein
MDTVRKRDVRPFTPRMFETEPNKEKILVLKTQYPYHVLIGFIQVNMKLVVII